MASYLPPCVIDGGTGWVRGAGGTGADSLLGDVCVCARVVGAPPCRSALSLPLRPEPARSLPCVPVPLLACGPCCCWAGRCARCFSSCARQAVSARGAVSQRARFSSFLFPDLPRSKDLNAKRGGWRLKLLRGERSVLTLPGQAQLCNLFWFIRCLAVPRVLWLLVTPRS